MQRIVNQIRDLELIEKELNSASAGVLAVNIDTEKTLQRTSTFLYLDKNIYLFFKLGDELYEKIQFDSVVSFSVLKNDKIKKHKIDFSPSYNFFSVSINGLIKKVDEAKVIADVKENYLKKYSKKSDISKKNISALGELVIIDTEEIHAFEEIGG